MTIIPARGRGRMGANSGVGFVRHAGSPATWVGRIRAFVIPASQPDADETYDDYRPLVSLIAILAVGFFVPSLLIAGVPAELWPQFTAAAVLAGSIIAGSFFALPRPGTWTAIVSAILNSLVVAVLGFVIRGYYHEIALLFALVVAAHAVLHGMRPALVAVAMGTFLVPTTIQGSISWNLTDPVYAAIYLSGIAALPWTARGLAERRSTILRRQVAATLEVEHEAVLILARAAEAKDEVTGNHVARVGDLAAALAERVGLTGRVADDLRYAAMLHDVGKLHVPDQILMKPGRLTADEWAVVKMHTVWGERILGSTAGFETARRIARSHHENWDGSGYPDGLAGETIPLDARIVHVVDVFDALRSRRPYKEAWPLDQCIDELAAGRGSRYDPELVNEFMALLDANPVLATIRDLGPTQPQLERVRIA